MEQTLGNRIMQERKRLGLTQEQLAEKLGVTAQAVSKWEHDQSCPDITALPRLADIFGISTDELLGRRQNSPSPREDVVDEPVEDGEKEGFEFTYDSGRKGGVFLGLLVLSVGILYLLDKLLSWNIGLWNIFWPTTLIIGGIFSLTHKFRISGVACILFGGYTLLNYARLLPFALPGELVVPIIIVLLGLSLLLDAMKKPNKRKIHFSSRGKEGSGNSFTLDGNRFVYHAGFGEARQSIPLEKLEGGEVHTSFGEFTVDLSAVNAVEPDCVLEAHCSFGELKLLVPRRFQVKPNSSTAFASVDFKGHCSPNPTGVICLNANVSFGEIEVEYI